MFKFEVKESPETLDTLLKQEKDVRRRERLQLLYWYKTGQAKTRQALGKWLNRSQVAIGQWLDTYRQRGLNGLLQLNYRGGNLAPSIPADMQCQLKEKLAQPEGFASYKAIQVWLKATPGLEVPYSTVLEPLNTGLKLTSKSLDRMRLVRFQTQLKNLKKTVPANLNEIACACLKRYSRIRYWRQDESRFGLQTLTRRRLTLTKVKPLVQGQWRVKAFYLYGVVEPLTGEGMIQPYDRVTTENFPQFLNAFSQQYPMDFHVIQTDNARFHCGNKLLMPDNVRLLYQPPHSPQVNSAEQL
ncbi:MAG TPA: IS630 family transposase [Saprospiraceae bacterium]|nr:IS630 family transposase [Saprospiraceae bacterium]